MKKLILNGEYVLKAALNRNRESARKAGSYLICRSELSDKLCGLADTSRRVSPFGNLFQKIYFAGLFSAKSPYFIARAENGLVYFYDESLKTVSPGFQEIESSLCSEDSQDDIPEYIRLKHFIAQESDGLKYLYDFSMIRTGPGYTDFSGYQKLLEGCADYYTAQEKDGLYYLFNLHHEKVGGGYPFMASGLTSNDSLYTVCRKDDGKYYLLDYKLNEISGGFPEFDTRSIDTRKGIAYCLKNDDGRYYYYKNHKKITRRGYNQCIDFGDLTWQTGYILDKNADNSLTLYDRKERPVLENVVEINTDGLSRFKTGVIWAKHRDGTEGLYDRYGREISTGHLNMECEGFISGKTDCFTAHKADGLAYLYDRKGKVLNGPFKEITFMSFMNVNKKGFYSARKVDGLEYLYDKKHCEVAGGFKNIYYMGLLEGRSDFFIAEEQNRSTSLYNSRGKKILENCRYVSEYGLVDGSSSYVLAGKLDGGDCIFNRKGRKVCEGFERISEAGIFYNENHHFFIGAKTRSQDAVYHKNGTRETPCYKEIQSFKARGNRLFYYVVEEEKDHLLFYDADHRCFGEIPEAIGYSENKSLKKGAEIYACKNRKGQFNFYRVSKDKKGAWQLSLLNGGFCSFFLPNLYKGYRKARFYAAVKTDRLVRLYDYEGRELQVCRALFNFGKKFYIRDMNFNLIHISGRGKPGKPFPLNDPRRFQFEHLA